MGALHQYLGWATVALNGVAGVWGLVIDRRRAKVPPGFWVATGAALSATVTQIALGVYLVAAQNLAAGDQHVFYGIVVAFVLAFAYIYRAQLRRRPALSYGLLLLFNMGLALRAIATLDLDF